MRKALVALLVLSPMMLNAQANTPAKTQVLESKLNSPKGFVAAEVAAPTSALRVSTGVTAPKVISTVPVSDISNPRYPLGLATDPGDLAGSGSERQAFRLEAREVCRCSSAGCQCAGGCEPVPLCSWHSEPRAGCCSDEPRSDDPARLVVR